MDKKMIREYLDKPIEVCKQEYIRGNVEAAYKVGLYFLYGIDVEHSLGDAKKWFTLAAIQGHALAQNNLGVCYMTEEEEEAPQYKHAKIWLTKSAEQGCSSGQYNLGTYYFKIEKNYQEAIKWFNIASTNGSTRAYYELGKCYYFGLGAEESIELATKYYRLSKCDDTLEIDYHLHNKKEDF